MIFNQPRLPALVAVMSSVLLLPVAVEADQHMDSPPNPPVKTTLPTDDSRPPATPDSPDAETAEDTARTEVGSEKSNVDKDSTSGSYYPYSAGTVGDDPSEPKSTSVSPETGDRPPGPTDQWGDAADADGDGYLSLAELTKAAPALSAHFDAMDVDGDDKLTRAEFRTWHESRKARVNGDEDARSTPDEGRSSSSTRPDRNGD